MSKSFPPTQKSLFNLYIILLIPQLLNSPDYLKIVHISQLLPGTHRRRQSSLHLKPLCVYKEFGYLATLQMVFRWSECDPRVHSAQKITRDAIRTVLCKQGECLRLEQS